MADFTIPHQKATRRKRLKKKKKKKKKTELEKIWRQGPPFVADMKIGNG
jgi:hypothetical protein